MDKGNPSATHGNAVAAYLEIIGDSGGQPAFFPIQDELVIGREPQDSLGPGRFLCIPRHTISRRHARIRCRGGEYFIEDLHSFNGTYVTGSRLAPGQWHPLHDGEELAVSNTQLVFHSLVAPPIGAMPSIISMSVDASDATRFVAPAPDASKDDLQRAVQKLHAMAQVSIALGAVKDQDTLIEKIMNFIFDLFPLAERAFIVLRRNKGEQPAPVAARRRDGKAEDPAQAQLSRTLLREVLEKKRAILSVDTLADRHFGAQHSIIAQAIRSVMCVPLLLEDECLGLIQVDTSSDPHAFKEQDLELLTGVCAETAVALKNFQLYSDIEQLLDGFVRASVQAIEERDPVTAGHSFRVAAYASHLAQALERSDDPQYRRFSFSRDQLREIRYAALLHDFGKVGVAEHVLRKEKKLYPKDMLLLEQRFLHARACLERQAYRKLVGGAAEAGGLHGARARMEQELQQEFHRLDSFLEAIRSANEPSISHCEGGHNLREILDYGYEDGNDSARLLHQAEFEALSLPKGCLTPEERRQIESHVADSYSFLILIPWTRDLAAVPTIAHGHHEKLDGSGYPMGLKGNQISVQTRILTICDIFDALTAADRPYKKAVPVEQALDLLSAECRAQKLDGGLFRIFVESRAWTAA
ncbi:MAG TPA: HD domain-containing phosphohydrolase [Noviherbaspirillum sp.]|jgi:3',5'-cyclic-nucleotide phosphodiesterase|uniref:HD domain-containing phosphohydrolase n=1 Tax=Noviherbaspirillum sp. TaxID=1926288 RepID=UPI002F91D266